MRCKKISKVFVFSVVGIIQFFSIALIKSYVATSKYLGILRVNFEIWLLKELIAIKIFVESDPDVKS